MPRIRILFALAMLVGLWPQAVPAAELVDKIVAVVNGQMITLFELNAKVATLLERSQGVTYKPDDPRYNELRRQVLDVLVGDILLKQEAARFKAEVSDKEVEGELDGIRRKNGLTEEQFRQQLAKEGMTRQEFAEQLKMDATKKRVLGIMVHRKIIVTDDEVRAYYEKNRGNLPDPKSLVLRPSGGVGFIMTPSMKEAEALREKIVSGQMTFADAARKHSIGPGKDKGGDLGDVSPKDLAPPLRDALAQIKPGEVTRPIVLDGKGVLLTLRKTDDAPAPAPVAAPEPAPGGDAAFAAVREEIRELLYRTKFDALFQEYMDKLKSKAVVDIRL